MIQCRTASPTLQFKYACLCRDEPDMRWMEPQILLRGFDVPKASGCEHLRSMLRHRLPASPYPCGNHHHRADKMRPSFHVTLPFVFSPPSPRLQSHIDFSCIQLESRIFCFCWLENSNASNR
uniref:Uncharacterized protein n=1 Tax=Mesocestoides corti TaxID=53468 RepID=A0A5K3FER9_MESCO